MPTTSSVETDNSVLKETDENTKLWAFNFAALANLSSDLSFHPLWNKDENPNIENSERRVSFGLLNIQLEWALEETEWDWKVADNFYKNEIQKINWPIWLLNLKVWVQWELENQGRLAQQEDNEKLAKLDFSENETNIKELEKWDLSKSFLEVQKEFDY